MNHSQAKQIAYDLIWDDDGRYRIMRASFSRTRDNEMIVLITAALEDAYQQGYKDACAAMKENSYGKK